jgi:hypothetical protein
MKGSQIANSHLVAGFLAWVTRDWTTGITRTVTRASYGMHRPTSCNTISTSTVHTSSVNGTTADACGVKSATTSTPCVEPTSPPAASSTAGQRIGNKTGTNQYKSRQNDETIA